LEESKSTIKEDKMKRFKQDLPYLLLVGLVIVLIPVLVIAMTDEETKTAFIEGNTVYYTTKEIHDYLNWDRPDLPGAPFDEDTTIPSGVITQMTNVPTVVEGALVDNWTATVNGQAMKLDRLYISKESYQAALKARLTTKSNEASAISTTDTEYADSVDEIGKPLLEASVNTLDFGDVTTEMTFEISNTGEGELDWTIIVVPDVVEVTVDPLAGDTKKEKDIITVTVDRQGAPPATYNPTLEISSDGGSATVTLTVVVK
jgi:hypothetical protein